MLSLGSFKTGAILLVCFFPSFKLNLVVLKASFFTLLHSHILQAGLFVYDIFWVFFTPVMVSVAKSFDAPIKVILFAECNGIICL